MNNLLALCSDLKIAKLRHNTISKIVSFQVKFEKVDITEDENKQWYRKYRYDIPVFHLNGQFLMKHRVNENLLTEKLLEIEKTNKMDASKT